MLSNRRRTLLFVFIAALLVRGGFVLLLQTGFYFPDSVEYSSAAINLINNGELGENYHRPPGYPVFLAGIYLLLGENILAVRMVESVMGAFLAVAIAMIGRRVGGETVGVIAGLLWSIYPIGVFIAGLVYPTGLLATLLACGVLCILPDSHQEFSPRRLFAAGVILGLAALTVPVVVVTIGVLGVWLIYWSSSMKRVSLLFLGAALVIAPWMIRDFYVYDRVVLVEPRVGEHLPRMRSADSELRSRKVEAILYHPDEFAAHYAHQFLHFWKLYPDRLAMDRPGYREQWHENDHRVVKHTIFSPKELINAVSILSTGPLFLFATVGTLAMCFEKKRRRDAALLWGLILSFALVYSMFYTRTRYRIPIEPFIIILSAYGLKTTLALLAAPLPSWRQRSLSLKVGEDR